MWIIFKELLDEIPALGHWKLKQNGPERVYGLYKLTVGLWEYIFRCPKCNVAHFPKTNIGS